MPDLCPAVRGERVWNSCLGQLVGCFGGGGFFLRLKITHPNYTERIFNGATLSYYYPQTTHEKI